MAYVAGVVELLCVNEFTLQYLPVYNTCPPVVFGFQDVPNDLHGTPRWGSRPIKQSA